MKLKNSDIEISYIIKVEIIIIVFFVEAYWWAYIYWECNKY